MKTQFEPWTLPPSPPSSQLTTITQLHDENQERQVQAHLNKVEQHLTAKPTLQTPPTLPETPPPKASEHLQKLGQVIEVNRTTAATQWAIDAHKSVVPETNELPHHYRQHWHIFSEKLAQCFLPAQKDDHAIKL